MPHAHLQGEPQDTVSTTTGTRGSFVFLSAEEVNTICDIQPLPFVSGAFREIILNEYKEK